MAAITTATLLLLCPASAHAQGGVPLWTNRYDGPGREDDLPRAMAVDSLGNVFVTGLSSPGRGIPYDYATIAYSSVGIPLWTNRYNGDADGYDGATAIAVYGNGNVFVTGGSDGGGTTIAYSYSGAPLWTNRSAGFENALALDGSGNVFVTGELLDSNRSPDFATIKYSNSGTPLWTNLYSGPANYDDRPVDIAVDSTGSVIVTGRSQDNQFNDDYATIMYSSAGIPLWTKRYNGPGNLADTPAAIAVDREGNVFVTGSSQSANTDFDYATIKHSSVGNVLWTRRYNGPVNGHDWATALAVDRNGTVLVTGYSASAAAFPYNYDYATVAYSSAGVPLWTNRYDGSAHMDELASGITADSAGNVFVTGVSWSGSNAGYATVAYSNSGMPLWTNRYDGPGNNSDEPVGIAVDASGNVFVTGSSWNGSNSDFVTIKYSSIVPPPRLHFQLLNYQLVLSWTNAGFNLQSAPAVTGMFTNVPAATSPYTNALTGPQLFFRLRGE